MSSKYLDLVPHFIRLLFFMFLTINLSVHISARDASIKSWSKATVYKGWCLSISPVGHGNEVALTNKSIECKCAPMMVDYMITINKLLHDGEVADAKNSASIMANSLCKKANKKATNNIEILFTESAAISQQDLWAQFIERFINKYEPICRVDRDRLASYWDIYKDSYYFVPLADESHILLYQHDIGTYTIFHVSSKNKNLQIEKWNDSSQHFRSLEQEFWIAEFNPDTFSDRIYRDLLILGNLATDFYTKHERYPTTKEIQKYKQSAITDPWGEQYLYFPDIQGAYASILTTGGKGKLELKNIDGMQVYVAPKKEWCCYLKSGIMFKLDDAGSLREALKDN